MNPIVLPHDHPDVSDAVHTALEIGQTVIFPTDTVYGIGGNPWDAQALARVRTLKQRDAGQPFTLHLWSVSEVPRYACCSDRLLNLIHQLLPGPITLLLPASPHAPPSTVLEGVVGIRVPPHPFFATVIRRPVFGTSVNERGAAPINDAAEIIESFRSVDLIITGEVSGTASVIVNLAVSPYRVLRGTLPEEMRKILEQE